MQQYGKWMIIAGGILILVGVILFYHGDKLRWFGHLPGDIRIERENFRLYIPLTTMLIVSIIITLIRWLSKNI